MQCIAEIEETVLVAKNCKLYLFMHTNIAAILYAELLFDNWLIVSKWFAKMKKIEFQAVIKFVPLNRKEPTSIKDLLDVGCEDSAP